jgi:hypothetical protein
MRREYRHSTGDNWRATCGPGPWQDEPDKIVWVDPETGLDCMILRGRIALCGYVGVGPDHPWYGKEYQELDVEVHGSLTYSNTCQEGWEDPGQGVCHVPEEGREHDIYWFGFDCGHMLDLTYFDLTDEMPEEIIALRAERPDDPFFRQEYRNVAYVTAEVESLAKQIAAAA